MKLIYQLAESNVFTFQFYDGEEELQILMDDIQKSVSASPSLLPMSAMKVGLPVLAKYSEGNLWYRGILTALPEDETVEVLFVDYGNSEAVPHAEVQSMKSEFMTLCKQVFTCHLQGSSGSVVENWSAEMVGLFEKLGQDMDYLTATVVKCESDSVIISFVEHCPEWSKYFPN